jgi:hypothetical protein
MFDVWESFNLFRNISFTAQIFLADIKLFYPRSAPEISAEMLLQKCWAYHKVNGKSTSESLLC